MSAAAAGPRAILEDVDANGRAEAQTSLAMGLAAWDLSPTSEGLNRCFLLADPLGPSTQGMKFEPLWLLRSTSTHAASRPPS